MLLKIIDRICFNLIFKWIYKKKFKYYGDNITWGPHFKRKVIPRNIRISIPSKIIIEDNCQFDEFVALQCHYNGDGITIKRGTRCNSFTQIQSYSHILIGESVLIAPFSLISSGDHGHMDIQKPIMDQQHYPSGEIEIGSGSWIGHGSKILGGSIIGKNSVVAAGAVLTGKKFPNYTLIAGIPGKIIKDLSNGG